MKGRPREVVYALTPYKGLLETSICMQNPDVYTLPVQSPDPSPEGMKTLISKAHKGIQDQNIVNNDYYDPLFHPNCNVENRLVVY